MVENGNHRLSVLLTTVCFIVALVLLTIYFYWNRVTFGQWSQPVDGRCEGICGSLGTRTTVEECIPDPSTGRGCIGTDGQETYLPKYTVKECNVQCHRSVWRDIQGDCINGFRLHTKECVQQDLTGNNNCYLAGVRYEIGDEVVTRQVCDRVPKDVYYWQPVPRAPSLPLLSSYCITRNNRILEEGYLERNRLCFNDQGLSVDTSLCNSTVPSIYTVPCRYIPRESRDFFSTVVILEVDGGVVTLSKNGTTMSTINTLNRELPCSRQEVIRDTGSPMMFTLKKRLTSCSYLCSIGCMVRKSSLGWLGVNCNNELIWTSTSGSLTYQQAQEFVVTVHDRDTRPVDNGSGSMGTANVSISTKDGVVTTSSLSLERVTVYLYNIREWRDTRDPPCHIPR